MESLSPKSTYASRSSKKRVFNGGSSSSRCNEVECLGISSPAANGRSIRKPSKQKEVICHEIIDLDVEVVRRNGKDKVICHEIIDLDAEVVRGNGKDKEPMCKFSADRGSLANYGSGSDAYIQDNSFLEDSSYKPCYGEDEWIDKYYEDIVFDDYDVLQSHYDHMDIPSGVETPFPWLPGSPQNDILPHVPSVSTSSKSKINANGTKASSDLSKSPPLVAKRSTRFGKSVKALSSDRATRSVFQHLDGTPSTSPLESGLKKYSSSSSIVNRHAESPAAGYLHQKKYISSRSIVHRNAESSAGGSLHQKKYSSSSSIVHRNAESSAGGSLHQKGPFELGNFRRKFIKRMLMGSNLNSGSYPQFPTGSLFSTDAYNLSVSETSLSGPIIPGPVHHSDPLTLGAQAKLSGVGTYPIGWEKDMPRNIVEPPTIFSIVNGAYSPRKHPDHQNGEIPMGLEQKNLDEILRNFDGFKKFDTLEDCSDHHYYNQSSFGFQVRNQWAKTIQEEWKILENSLPDTIFVRAYESRMDLLRAVILGADGTPYHDGLFFFDICFPHDYPNSPPNVHYRSGGLRINPNLYEKGTVCLSLLNTWHGDHKEMWTPGVSTILQVLVSIQGLILNTNPFFNEPMYSKMLDSESGELLSVDYNEKTFLHSLQTMVYTIRKPPKHFEDFVIGHFCKHAREILLACQAYLDGAQVGSLVKGGIQDVKANNKNYSPGFTSKLAGYIITIVNALSTIGAKDCDQFLSLAQKGNGNPTAASRPSFFS